jgi:hypothetical protein
MARFVTGNEFNTGDQVTATTLNNAVNNAKASTDSVDNSSIAVDGSGVLSVKTSTSASDGVTFAKFQQIPANTVLVRDANSLGSVSAKAVTDTQILIGDGTGFTSAALSGDVTMTNAGAVTIANDAVTGAKISDSAALPDGVTATTQAAGDDSTKVATTAFVQDMRPVYCNATGGTNALYVQNRNSDLTYNLSQFTSGDTNFSPSRMIAVIVEAFTRSEQGTNEISVTLPTNTSRICRTSAFGGGDDVEDITTTYIPINAGQSSITFFYTVQETSKPIYNFILIKGFVYMPKA